MEVPEVKRLRTPEMENTRRRKLLAEAMLDKGTLQLALGRRSDNRPKAVSHRSHL